MPAVSYVQGGLSSIAMRITFHLLSVTNKKITNAANLHQQESSVNFRESKEKEGKGF